MAKHLDFPDGSEGHFRVTFEPAPVGIGHIAADGRWLEVDGRLCKMLRYKPEELVGMPFHEVTHPEDRETDRAMFQRLMSREIPPFSFEKRCVCKDETVIWMRVNMSLTGEPDHVISVCEDVTERVQQDATLRKTNQALMVLSMCNAALVRAGDEAQLIETICGTITEGGGYAKAVVECAPGDEDGETDAGAGETTAPPTPAAIAMRTGEACVERNIDAVGEGAPWRAQMAREGHRAMIALPLNCESGVLGALTIYNASPDAFDIKEIKLLLELANDLAYGINALRVAAQRQQAEAQLRTFSWVVEQSPVLILLTDADGKILYVNQSFAKVGGYELDDVSGLHPLSLKSEGVPLDGYRAQWSPERRSENWVEVLPCRKKDGTGYWAETRVSPIRDNEGQILHYLEIGEDVTERREIDRQLVQARKMDGLGSMAGTIAHDFNNLLLPIVSLTQMSIRDLPEDSRNRKRLEKVLEAAERSRSLIARIMAFSRKTEVRKEPLEIHSFIAEVMELVRSTMPRTIRIEQCVDPLPLPVMADPSQIETAVLNLAGNAAHAMEGGTGVFSVGLSSVEVDAELARACRLPSTGYYARLSVSDTGCGMDDRTIEKIFDPFFTTKAKGQGTGFGLASVLSVVTNHGGNVRVFSKVGTGTTFEIYLPLMEPANGPADEDNAQDRANA